MAHLSVFDPDLHPAKKLSTQIFDLNPPVQIFLIAGHQIVHPQNGWFTMIWISIWEDSILRALCTQCSVVVTDPSTKEQDRCLSIRWNLRDNGYLRLVRLLDAQQEFFRIVPPMLRVINHAVMVIAEEHEIINAVGQHA
ncbi:hypothetical protein IC63_13985 [Paracoccus sphaerophysae]|uniref:Uncharacterized protein n=1 Tax=Paracoccus sphaerophysae TaxID=690417 RepID=A0A099EYC4_9RHOB|nr:hypothetical protein IC63_13985 [Paracoccus sphaerophysae]